MLLNKYYSGDKIKNNLMGEASSTCGRKEKSIHGFGGKNSLEKHKSDDKGVDGKIICKRAFKKLGEEMRTELICLVAGSCECGGETSSSIKSWKFI